MLWKTIKLKAPIHLMPGDELRLTIKLSVEDEPARVIANKTFNIENENKPTRYTSVRYVMSHEVVHTEYYAKYVAAKLAGGKSPYQLDIKNGELILCVSND